MKKLILLFLLAIVSGQVSAQIDMLDSTVQVVSYWKMGETQEYHVMESEIVKIKEDTYYIVRWQCQGLPPFCGTKK